MRRKGDARRALLGLIVVAAAVAGCGSDWDPESSRLDPGDLAFVVNPDTSRPSVTVPSYNDPEKRQPISVAVNARVLVLSDTGPESEKQRLLLVLEKGDPGSERRLYIPRRFIHRYHLARNDKIPKNNPASKAPSSEKSNWRPLMRPWDGVL
jgi:hypothetical protein